MQSAALIIGCIVLVLAVSVAAGFLASIPRERRLRRLAVERGQVDGYRELKRAVPGLSDEYGALIYRSLQGIVQTGFPLLPEDDIWKTLELDAGNLDSVIEDILEEAKRTPPPGDVKRQKPLNTVRDVVLFLNGCPCAGASEA